MDSSSACSSYVMPTADEFTHSAARMLHPHHSATFFLGINCGVHSPSKKNLPFPLGIPPPPLKKSSTDPPPQMAYRNQCAYTELPWLLLMYDKLNELTISQCDHRCMHNQSVNQSINSKLVWRHYTIRPGVPTVVSGPSRPTNPNDIQIQSAIFSQYIGQTDTDRQTDVWSRWYHLHWYPLTLYWL